MLNFIGFVLLSLRNILPVFITVVLANTLIVLCYAFIARGLVDFADGDQNTWVDIAPLFVFIIAFSYFCYVSPNVNARIVVISLVIMLVCLRCTSIASRKISVILEGKNWLLLTIFTLMALWFLLRSALTLSFEGKIHDFMSAGIIHGLSLIIATIGNIFIAIGLITINAQRIEEKVKKRTAELNNLNQVLTDSEERYRSLSDAAFEGIVISEKGIFLEVNNTMAKMYGYPKAELIGRRAAEFVEADMRKEIQNKILSGYEKPYESIGIKKNGTRFPIEVHAKMFAYKGRQVRVTAIRDLSEQKKAEEALRESERRYRALIETAPSIILHLSPEGRILGLNPEAERLFGCTRAEALGKNYLERFIPGEARGPIYQDFKEVLRAERTRGYENPVTDAYGKERILSWDVAPLLDDRNEATGVIAIGQDITERKQAEKEREKLIKDLQEALKEIKTLRGILPLCSFCKKIRDDKGYWEQVDVYIHKHLQADISHGICPECMKAHYPNVNFVD